MAVKKITKRWILNSFSSIVFVLIIILMAFSIGINWFYYNSIEQLLNSQANMINLSLAQYSKDSSVDFYQQVRYIVENFEKKDKIELMAIDADGKVIFTSSGFQPNADIAMPDYENAMNTISGVGIYKGKYSDDEIMALTVASRENGSVVSAIRLVVSLEKVKKQIALIVLIAVSFCAAILFFVVLSSSYFINSIVNPISEVSKIARKIAQGDFNIKLNKTNDDEIGELCETINYMAEELSNAEKIKNDFISSVSHELRTPLTAIRGWTETMIDGNLDSDMTQKGMKVIMNETERLSQMVEELLDFSRMQSGRLKLIVDKFDLIAELSDAVLMYTERARRENIELVYDEPEIYTAIYGDKNRIRQVFINIIDNALKYSDNGGKVEIAAALRGNKFFISVSDNGCGISSKDLPNIKQKFYKANLTRRGSGIGLAVADEIVMRHGGTLSLTSQEGKGTTVTIVLPADNKPGDIQTGAEKN